MTLGEMRRTDVERDAIVKGLTHELNRMKPGNGIIGSDPPEIQTRILQVTISGPDG